MDAEDPINLGLHPVGEFGMAPVNGTESRMTLRLAGGPNWTWLQSHDAVAVNGDVSLRIPPTGVEPTVEVRRTFVEAVGPPGTFNLTGNTTEDKIRSFEQRLGLPSATNLSEEPQEFHYLTRWRAKQQRSRTVLLYGSGSQAACIEGSAGECQGEATFRLECSNCREWTRTIPPVPHHELTNRTDGKISFLGGTNRIWLLFDGGGELVAAQIGPSYNLDVEAVLDSVQARDVIVDDIHRRGYRLGDIGFEPDNASFIDETQFEFVFAGDGFEPAGARYVWAEVSVVDPPEEGSGDRYGDSLVGRYVQDAQTGEILNATFRPGTVTAGPDNPLPAPGLALVLAAGAAAALAWRRWS